MNCIQKQQLVSFPKVRIWKPWFRHFNNHKEFHNEGTVHLFSLMALFSYANFRSNERMISGARYMEAPGQWICKLGSLPRILRVHSKRQALEQLDYYEKYGFLTYEWLDEENEIIRFSITNWKEHCTSLQYNYYSYKGSGFFFFPLPVGRMLLRIAHKTEGIVFSELDAITKMLCAQGAAGVLRDFADVLAVPIPELTPMFGFPQHNPHHDKDVWDHTIAVIESITPEPVLRWAALLHDIGKPSCLSLAEDGIGHFFGHSDQSTSMAESILSRLRFDNASKEQIVRLVRYHDMPITADRKPIKRLLSKHGEDATRQLIELHKADTLGQSAICRHRIAIFEEVSQMINEILQEESCFTLKDLAVNGHDMMTLGFQGPTIGRVLQECLDAVLDEQIPNEHEALMAFAKDRQLKS